ncbi:PP2C family protein-serine/threonine phosphatase [Streptomyces fuscigenes]|uniref:PP2C family protein-serine/threonine phosphatase n=1 Tax=Streptomyces fuscigenes TaxID=1528880 RepID=UPI001F363103|nr:PP2C family protein-serine/threonine phosphatase [Streptomyces fuscigenes]MCF3963396.1 serine/threonine-protein phosphatase [Streptomyces fuscigenes]
MTSSAHSSRTTATVAVGAAAAPCPVVVLDQAGRIVEFNPAAGVLFPEARTGTAFDGPAWLSRAQGRPGEGEAAGAIGERHFAAHPTALPDGTTAWWLVEETAYHAAMEELEAERGRTQFLIRASSRLLASLNLGRCMEVTAGLAAEHLADAAVVVAPAAAGPLPVIICDRQGAMRHTTTPGALESVPGLAEALRGFPPVPSRWIDPAALPEWMVPEGFGRVGSVAITPLPGHGVAAGALILLRRGGHADFSESEEGFAGLFAARAGAAMSAARLYAEQNAISDTLMRELLPPELRQVQGVEFAGGYRASGETERVGGDFYDLHPPGEDGNETLAVLGDVCGKGLQAAVLAGKIRNTFQALLPLADDHPRMLRLLNNALVNGDHTRFATVVLASARREGKHVRLRLTAAGHPAPLIVRRDGSVEEADTSGSLVGALPTITARTAHVTLAPGETCLMYTDGITEARGGPLGDALFGEQRLRRALAECAGMPAEAVVERVQMLASQWVGSGRHDDMAVVAVTAPRGTHLSAVNGTTLGRYTA